MESVSPVYSKATASEKSYSPPWADLSIIGIAGSSGSGKTSVAMEIVKSLNLPWVVILVMVLPRLLSAYPPWIACLAQDDTGLVL